MIKAKRIKPSKLKTVGFLRVGRIIIWVLISFLILRGIGTVLRTNEAVRAEEIIQQFVDNREYKQRVEREAESFAEGFVIEYMTFSRRNPDEYYSRINKYLPTPIANLDMVLTSDTEVQAIDAKSISLIWYSDYQLNIDVKAKVKYTLKRAQEDAIVAGDIGNLENTKGTELMVVVKDVYIRVPVMELESKYIIEDYPIFIPEPIKAKAAPKQYTAEAADSNITQEIDTMLTNFFRTYCSGTTGEIEYYMLESDSEITGLNKSLEFEELEEARVFKTAEPNVYTAIATIYLKDPDAMQKLKQRYRVDVVNKDGRYYIKDFDVRTVNLKE